MNSDSANRRSDNEETVALSVIAPCHNEEHNIDPLVDRTLAVFDSMNVTAELVLIDDGSSDATWRRIARRSQSDRRVHGSRHSTNRGIVGAWRTGLEESSGEIICLIDADLQNRPEDIARLHEAYVNRSCDIMQGVRQPAEGVRRLRLFSQGLNLLLNLAFRMRLRDNKSGFILCGREVLTTILQHRYTYRYFQSFIGVSAAARGFTVGEVNTLFEPRQHGQSFLSTFPVLVSARIAWELVKFRVESLGFRAPAATGRSRWSMPATPAEIASGRL